MEYCFNAMKGYLNLEDEQIDQELVAPKNMEEPISWDAFLKSNGSRFQVFQV